MQARFYDPVIGRFLSNDPVGFSPDRPDMFGRYTYVANDPVNLVDPPGMCSYDADGIAGNVVNVLNEDGGIVWVTEGEGTFDYDTSTNTGVLTFGEQSAELSFEGSGTTLPDAPVPADEVLERELSHGFDSATNSAPSGVSRVDASGRVISAAEARAINRTNAYRSAKGRGYQRTGKEYE